MTDLFDRDPADRRPGRSTPAGRGGAAAPKPRPASAPQAEASPPRVPGGYSAADIEVLEGLEPVRRRPGMYVGGTDEAAYHHLASEIIDNAMDEAVAGHARSIAVSLETGDWLTVRDDGRGIPVDPHPKYPDRSALEVILTTLHSGGKFGGGAYQTSGGLHGVGSSVVNALSARLEVEVSRDKGLWRAAFEAGLPVEPLARVGNARGRGTSVRFRPDPSIFGPALHFDPARLYRLCRSKAFLFRGVTLHWRCDPALVGGPAARGVPHEATLHFPGGLGDSLADEIGPDGRVAELWSADTKLPTGADGRETGRVEWALCWRDPDAETGQLTDDAGQPREAPAAFLHSFCNTVPTPQGGTHEAGFRTALLKGLRAWGEHRNNRRAALVAAEDVIATVAAKLSLFLRDPQFQGQTKEKLTSPEAARLVEGAIRDRFDHFLAGHPAQADAILAHVIERAEERKRLRDLKDTPRKSATRRLRLPGKLTDCTRENAAETEIFLVEGDSAGGSAKQARNRETQAILPLRGKILNVASASTEKLRHNAELRDLVEALGCGAGERYEPARLRYGRVIIMTDADVDGAHIASLLMTFFHRELPALVRDGHLFLAQPPLYRLVHGGKTVYAMNDGDLERRRKRDFKPGAKVEVSRFKGLGEMPVGDLKRTTMDPAHRTLLRVDAPNEKLPETNVLVDSLMGRRPELRFAFIQARARTVATQELDI